MHNKIISLVKWRPDSFLEDTIFHIIIVHNCVINDHSLFISEVRKM